MKKKKILSAVLIAMMSMNILTACGDSSNEVATLDETEFETEAATTTIVDDTEYSDIAKNSLNRIGNTTRLKEKIAQARAGETTTIAYIGGSITEGVGGTVDTCYAYLSYESFANTYGTGDNVQYVNAGLSGTPSILGNCRLERDVLSYEPDIVFIEFAVNDGQDTITKQSYESMVKTILEQDNAPAVVIICNILKSGYSAQSYMLEIAEWYDLPVVSMADTLTIEFDEGRLTWEEYSNDESHPNSYGHSLVAECISYMFSQVDKAEDDGEYTIKQVGINGTPYENATMITPDMVDDESVTVEGIEIISTGSFEAKSTGTSGFATSWKYTGGDEPLKLKVTANALFMIIRRNNNDSMGSFDIYLDGEYLTTINSNQSDGWGEAYANQVIKYQSVHEMEIEIYCSEGSEEKELTILGFAFSQNTTF